MECEKGELAETKELMDYYKGEINEAARQGRSLIPYKERHLHSAIKYVTLLEFKERDDLERKNQELDSMLENITQSCIPKIAECRQNIDHSQKRLEEYDLALKRLNEEREALPMARGIR